MVVNEAEGDKVTPRRTNMFERQNRSPNLGKTVFEGAAVREAGEGMEGESWEAGRGGRRASSFC